jgi:hypothetical protein
LSGVGENDFLDIALGHHGDDEHLLEASGGGFCGLFYPYAGRPGGLAYIPEIGRAVKYKTDQAAPAKSRVKSFRTYLGGTAREKFCE